MSREEIEGLVGKLSDQRHLMQGDGILALMETATGAAQALTALLAEIDGLREALTNIREISGKHAGTLSPKDRFDIYSATCAALNKEA